MRPEAVLYGQQYCASIVAWEGALDSAIDWSTAARLDPAAATTPDPRIAAALAVMRARNAEIATLPPVVPVARALDTAADRIDSVVSALAPVLADPTAASTAVDQHLPRVYADMAAAAEFHRVAQGNYGPLGCPPEVRPRASDAAGIVSVSLPDGWILFGPTAEERESQLGVVDDPAYAARIRQQGDAAGSSGAVIYDAEGAGRSGIGAVTWFDLLPGETDLLGAMEAFEAELALDPDFSDIDVRYLDRPAGDGARLVVRSMGADDPDELIVDVVRVEAGLVLVASLVPEADAPSYWLAIERIVGSLGIGDAASGIGAADGRAKRATWQEQV